MEITVDTVAVLAALAIPAVLATVLLWAPVFGLALTGTGLLYAGGYLAFVASGWGGLAPAALVAAAGVGACAASGVLLRRG
jgi:CHASE2 domain-containing sensor protein